MIDGWEMFFWDLEGVLVYLYLFICIGYSIFFVLFGFFIFVNVNRVIMNKVFKNFYNLVLGGKIDKLKFYFC